MGKRDAIEAFIRGDIGRRDFIGRLTTLGVSAGAAAAYAVTLGGQSTSANGSRNSSGYLVRYQTGEDEEYGTAITLESDEQGISLALVSLYQVSGILLAVNNFTSDDFEPEVFETLTTIFEQQQEHADALLALLDQLGGGEAEVELPAAEEFASPDDFLASLAEAFAELTALYAAIVPALEDGEIRQAVMNIASVASRHAALVNTFAGVDPLPETFQEPTVPEE